MNNTKTSSVMSIDRTKSALHLPTDHGHVVREAIRCCAKGGTLSIPGVYLSNLDNMPLSAAMNKGLTFKMGQTHVQNYLEPLLKQIIAGNIDPSKIITHRIKLKDAPDAYKTFNEKADGCIKVVITPE